MSSQLRSCLLNLSADILQSIDALAICNIWTHCADNRIRRGHRVDRRIGERLRATRLTLFARLAMSALRAWQRIAVAVDSRVDETQHERTTSRDLTATRQRN